MLVSSVHQVWRAMVLPDVVHCHVIQTAPCHSPSTVQLVSKHHFSCISLYQEEEQVFTVGSPGTRCHSYGRTLLGWRRVCGWGFLNSLCMVYGSCSTADIYICHTSVRKSNHISYGTESLPVCMSLQLCIKTWFPQTEAFLVSVLNGYLQIKFSWLYMMPVWSDCIYFYSIQKYC